MSRAVLLRALNRVGAAADRVAPPDLGERGLKALAERRTGLRDWGDPAFDEGLRVLLASLQADARLHFVGGRMVQGLLVHALSVRLGFVDAVRRQPDIAARPPRRPLVVVSMPRTGSTLLQRLLATDPAALSLPLWLQMAPFPPPTAHEWLRGGGARLHRSRAPILLSQLLTPGATAKHRAGASLPEECGYLLLGSGTSLQYWAFWPVHGYAQWLLDADPVHPYRFLRQCLALLQQHLPGSHWVLKSPMHFVSLPTLLAELPEARIVLLHRDPVRCVPSTHSLLQTMHEAVSDQIQLARTVAFDTAMMAERGAQVAAIRDGPHAERFLDVRYAELVAEPLRVARDIYKWADLPWSEQVAQRMAAISAHRPRPHAYSLARYGQSEAEIREAFSAYIDRFAPGEG